VNSHETSDYNLKLFLFGQPSQQAFHQGQRLQESLDVAHLDSSIIVDVKLQRRYANSDLEEIARLSKFFIEKYSNSEVLVAGATGFIGSWIIASIQHMNRFHSANIKVIGIARNVHQSMVDSFPETNFLSADISKSPLNIGLHPECVFNAATPSTPAHGGEHADQVMSASHQGTKNLIEALKGSTKSRFINLSSGIVTKQIGDQILNPNIPKDAYLEGKRLSEKSVVDASANNSISGVNLRLYAFAGPGIPLVDHFAVGNFMNDALKKNPILIKGNPETRRSYLYPTDLLANIFASTHAPSGSSLEIGSPFDISMLELANLINSVVENVGIVQSEDYGKPDAYFPIQDNLLVKQSINLETSLERWAAWLGGD